MPDTHAEQPDGRPGQLPHRVPSPRFASSIWPEVTERELGRYLDCGILAHDFARARCSECGHNFLIAYSCKCRGVCPSCTTCRMVETAAHRADHVIARLPVRQWVLAVEADPAEPLHRNAARYVGALLLARIYEGLPLLCPRCGGKMRIIAFITEAAVCFSR